MSVFKARINGKVLSGHPIVTSTGNTLRVISYLKYLEYKIQQDYPSFRLYPGQAGDDGMHIVVIKKGEYKEKGFKDYLLKQVHHYIGSNIPKGLNGLG